MPVLLYPRSKTSTEPAPFPSSFPLLHLSLSRPDEAPRIGRRAGGYHFWNHCRK